MHHTLTAALAARYGAWIRWDIGSHAPPDHEDVPHLGGGTEDGWYGLQERLFRSWSSRDTRWVLAQVKEKFAELTIYADPEPGQDEIDWRAIHYVATASRRVCESCGAPGRRAEGGGWHSTVCARHRNFAVHDRDAAERGACPTEEAVLACLASQRARSPEPDATPDVDWVSDLVVPRNLGERMQALDTAITWLLELDRPQLQPTDLETVLDPNTTATLDLPWTPNGLHRSTVIALCHAALCTAEAERQAEGGRIRLFIIHLPDVFPLPC